MYIPSPPQRRDQSGGCPRKIAKASTRKQAGAKSALEVRAYSYLYYNTLFLKLQMVLRYFFAFFSQKNTFFAHLSEKKDFFTCFSCHKDEYVVYW
ncbi:MAG: hypothetical protein E7663_01705 [Ruminococcaceae bacterium]|nr:hypothetical protein [Oscillospiraceae bacterium]